MQDHVLDYLWPSDLGGAAGFRPPPDILLSPTHDVDGYPLVKSFDLG
jgi:hypothetical protein